MATNPLNSGRILIIDDDDSFGELTRQRLEIAGHQVHFQHGSFGNNLKALRQGDFDVVVLDVNMPALSGTAICDLIRNGGSEKRSSVLLYSSMDEDALRSLAKRHSADDFACKTGPRAEIVTKVKSLLERRRVNAP